MEEGEERKLQYFRSRVIYLEFRIGRERARRLWMASQWSVARCAQCVVFFLEKTLSRNVIKKALLPEHNHLLTVIGGQQKIKPKYDACSLTKF
jgi:hypothetical protein